MSPKMPQHRNVRTAHLNIPLTDGEFESALYLGWTGYAQATLGQEHLGKYPVRARYVVSEAMFGLANEYADAGRPDKAGRLRWAASRVDSSWRITRRVLGK